LLSGLFASAKQMSLVIPGQFGAIAMSNLSKFLCLAAAACLFLLYANGLNGIFFIDDAPSLDGLQAVHDFAGAMHFITTGASGPLGRPLALASFLVGADSYPESARFFLLVNILIHLCNLLLVALLAFRLQGLLPRLFGVSPWFAPVAAFFWGVLPILASTSLMVIQRMTSLSALFVLLGVNLYLWGRMHQGSMSRVVWVLLGIGACTLLATFSKENGLLLPLLLSVLHLTLFGRSDGVGNSSPSKLLAWGLWLPSLLFLGYMCYRMPGIADTYWQRPFDLWERLATQPIILWEYLRVAFLPNVMALSPFHDDYPIYHFSDTTARLALVGWGLVLLIALGLWLKKSPLLLFALLWFLAGHLLESSMFALFLYFEHRNYIPILGPVLALSAVVQRLPVPTLHKGLAVGGYLTFLAFILWQVTSMWGNRQHLVWAQTHPDSPRAVQMLATAYLQAGRLQDADRLYERTFERNPQLTSIAMQGVRLGCYLQDDGKGLTAWVLRAEAALPNGDYSALTLQTLEAVAQLQREGRCHELMSDHVLRLADAMQRNPVFDEWRTLSRLHHLRAQVQLHERRVPLAMREAMLAIDARPDDMASIALLYRLKQEQDGQVAADRFLAEVAKGGPATRNPWVLRDWKEAMLQIGLQRE
jgi:tetratricopeptide (TPR) repeat protein